MKTPTTDQDKLQAFHRVRNLIPSKDKIEGLRRIARYLECGPADGLGEIEDADLLDGFAETLLLIRQAVRGGTKEQSGSRHWDGDD